MPESPCGSRRYRLNKRARRPLWRRGSRSLNGGPDDGLIPDLARDLSAPGLEVGFPEQGGTGGVSLRAVSEVDMKDQDMVLSIIVNAIQFALQQARKDSGGPGDVIPPEERVELARAILAALSEQGFEVTRAPLEPR